jgi:hypothetical protein
VGRQLHESFPFPHSPIPNPPFIFLSEVVVLLRNIFKTRWLAQEKKIGNLSVRSCQAMPFVIEKGAIATLELDPFLRKNVKNC